MGRPRGLAALVTNIRVHEGTGWVFNTSDGSARAQTPTRVSAEITVENDAIRASDTDAVLASLQKGAQDFTRAQDQLLFETLDKAIPAENSVHAQGRGFSAELYLKSMATVELQFNEDESWTPLEMYPKAANFDSELKRFETEDDLRQRRDELLEAGRVKWRDKERNRKLVD